MGFWQAVTGRSRPKQADLDALFLVPSAAITLQTTIGLLPTGVGSVCYRAADGAGFHETQGDVVELISGATGAREVEVAEDEFGFTWLTVHGDPADVAGLCTDLHGVNTTLEAEGFGPSLLCSLVPFADASGRRVGLVYLYKQGRFYPFAPDAEAGPLQRDTLLELQVRDALAAEIPLETDLGRWLALWGAPGL